MVNFCQGVTSFAVSTQLTYCTTLSSLLNTRPKWLTLLNFKMHAWRHPGKASLCCCMLQKNYTCILLKKLKSNVKYEKIKSFLNDVTLGIWKHLNNGNIWITNLNIVQYSDVHYSNGTLVFRPPFKYWCRIQMVVWITD